MLWHQLLLLGGLSGLAVAQEFYPDQICFQAASEILSQVPFAGDSKDSENRAATTCGNPLRLISLYASAQSWCTPEEFEAGLPVYLEECEEQGLPADPPSAFTANLTRERIRTYNLTDTSLFTRRTRPLTAPIRVTRLTYDNMVRTVKDFQDELWYYWTYNYALMGFWGLVLLFGAIFNLGRQVAAKLAARSKSDVEGSGPSRKTQTGLPKPLDSVWQFFRTHLVIPSVFLKHHRKPFWGLMIPTRLETALLAIYWILNLVLCSVNITAYDGNAYWAMTPVQVWRYLADRTGSLSYAQLPFLFLFSGRNNIFLWITGWEYSTFQIFHRHLAVIAVIEAIVHSIGYTCYEFVEAYGAPTSYYQSWEDLWWLTGGVATVTMSLILPLSIYWVRAKAYEFFLIAHILFVLVTLVLLFYHTAVMEGEFDPFLWACVAVWCFDRFARMVRQLFCNVGAGGFTKTIAHYSPEADLIRLHVFPGGSWIKPKPGQHYFIYQPLRIRGWENHPFTLATWANASNATQPTQEQALDVEKGSAPVPEDLALAPAGRGRLTFWIRPYSGWSRRLRDECLASANRAVHASFFVEGSYGDHKPLHENEHLLLIAGGSGLSAIFAYLQDYVERRGAPGSGTTTTRTRSVRLVWTARHASHVRECAGRELAPVLARPDVDASLYYTSTGPDSLSGGDNSSRSSHGDGEIRDEKEVRDGKGGGAIHSIGGRALTHRRPDVTALILDAAREASGAHSTGSLGVMVCGPQGMADEARAAVHKALRKGYRNVDYVEESFSW